MSEAVKQPRKIRGKVCSFAMHLPVRRHGQRDLHLIKERVVFDDGTDEPVLKWREDYKRSFYITKKAKRNHQSKKEREALNNVDEFTCTQSDLPVSIARALGERNSFGGLRQVCQSPYVYGADIKSTALIKHEYMTKYPGVNTRMNVAVCDIETKVTSEISKKQIILCSITCKSIVHIAVVKSFINGIFDFWEKINNVLDKHLGPYSAQRNINYRIHEVDSPAEAVISCINVAHKIMPDFLTFWNMDFDIPVMVKALEAEGHDPANIFSDPSVPRDRRFFEYRQGKKKKITASGKETPIKPSAQWHTVLTPASFYIIDSMCVYRIIRTGKAEEPSYSLNAILGKLLKLTKLEIEETRHLKGLKWHIEMQTNYRLEYIAYNAFDCISVEMADEKTNDLSLVIQQFSDCSDFSDFSSQPRRVVDQLHFYCLNDGYVIGSTGSSMREVEDAFTDSLDGWIITLAAPLNVDNGLCVITELPRHRTNARAHTGDLDVGASYPTNQYCLNVSKETTIREICRSELMQPVMRKITLNLSGGRTNAMQICQLAYNFPSHEELSQLFDRENCLEMTV